MDVARVSISDDEQRLLVVYSVQRALALAPDERTLLRECCSLLAQYRRYRLVWAGRLERSGAIEVTSLAGAAAGYLRDAQPRWDEPVGRWGNASWVVRHHRPHVLRAGGGRDAEQRALAEAYGIASIVTLPLRVEGEVAAVLTACSDEPNGFERKERRLLEGLCQDISRALQLMRMRASAADEVLRSRGRLRRLEAVRRLFDTAGGSEARRRLLLDEGARSLEMDLGAVGYVDGDAVRYQIVVQDRLATERQRSVPLACSLAAIAIRQGGTASWQDLGGGSGLPGALDLHHAGYRCAIVSPFEVEGRTYVLTFAARTPRDSPFQEEDHGYVELLASLFAQSVRESRRDEQIHSLRSLDQLTGLPNRASFEALLAQMSEDARAGRIAVIDLEIDGFRAINAALGYALGDRLLIEVAQRLRSVLRNDDVLARIGGNAFGIIVSAPAPEVAAEVALRLSARLADPATLDGNEVALSASVGIALYPDDAAGTTDLIGCAASAAAAMHVQGGDQPYRFYSREIGERLAAKRRFHRDVTRARERDEYRLYFQPQVDLRTGHVVAAEALLRWQDAERGVRVAAQFVPLAEETGLIASLDHWALRATIEQIGRWERAGRPLVVACNLSGQSARGQTLLGELRQLLARSGIDPAHLQIEITETVAMRDVAAACVFLQGCRDLGVTVALDDFGTGYSSLMHLKRLPVDAIKIDGSFVRGLPHKEQDGAIVRATIALGHSLGRHIVAECIENRDQAQWLTDQGCDLGQGHLYGPAMPVDLFETLTGRC